MLDISERQLRSWEKHSLIAPSEHFGFSDLIALRTIRRLRQSRIPAGRIRKTLTALRQKLHDVGDPLKEVKIVLEDPHGSRGRRRINVIVAGHKMEPVSGQLLLDFDEAEINKLLAFPGENRELQAALKDKATAERWFQKGLELEQSGAPVKEVVEAYEQAAKLDPTSSGALVNLGTVHFNQRSWREAEKYYRRALDIDPDYPLAHFNLANLFDELGDRTRAIEHYEKALELHPRYADAHYNLALLHQNSGDLMRAVRHWSTYIRLDPGSSWAGIARRELDKLRKAAVVEGARE